jgi:hypothetical protein
VLGKAATRSGSVQWRQTRTVAMGDRQHRPGRPRTPRSTHEATITSQILERTPLNRPLSTELTANEELIDQQLTDAARTHIQILRRFSNTHNIHDINIPLSVGFCNTLLTADTQYASQG